MRRRWFIDELAQLNDRYRDEGTKVLAIDLNRSVDSVSSKARVLGLRARRHRKRLAWNRATASPTVNARFFDDENPVTTWTLGMLWGCGKIRTKHRLVLSITLPKTKKQQFNEIRTLLSSRHHVQSVGDYFIVDIGNSRLVTTLIERFGPLPGSYRPNPDIPIISSEHLGSFCFGLNEIRGERSAEVISWTTTLNVADALVEGITQQARVGPPRTWTQGMRRTVMWSQLDDVTRIHRWLEGAAESIARFLSANDPLLPKDQIGCAATSLGNTADAKLNGEHRISFASPLERLQGL